MKAGKLIMFSICVSLAVAAAAQNTSSYNLQQSIDLALAKNLQVKQVGLQTEVAEVAWKQARQNVLPDANAIINHGINQGRSIDPFTNTYVTQAINYGSYGLGSGIVLFSGGSLQNAIKQNALGYEASRLEWQAAKDNLTLSVILTYLQVLSSQEGIISATTQKELSKRQVERLEILDRSGAISPAQLADVKGQLMNDELAILDLNNQLQTSLLSLAQLMNVPYNKNMRLEAVDTEEFLTVYDKNSSEVFEAAVANFALLKSVDLRKRSAAYAVKASRSGLYPSLILSGNLQTNYSSAAQNSLGKIPYSQQIGNNIFTGINLGLRIPLFNAHRAKNNIRLADIALRNTTLLAETATLQVQQQIEQSHLQMTNAYERYKALAGQVAAYTISFKAAEARFIAGVGTTVDYLLAKTNLDRASINLITAKYDFVLRKKILDYYQQTAVKN